MCAALHDGGCSGDRQGNWCIETSPDISTEHSRVARRLSPSDETASSSLLPRKVPRSQRDLRPGRNTRFEDLQALLGEPSEELDIWETLEASGTFMTTFAPPLPQGLRGPLVVEGENDDACRPPKILGAQPPATQREQP